MMTKFMHNYIQNSRGRSLLHKSYWLYFPLALLGLTMFGSSTHAHAYTNTASSTATDTTQESSAQNQNIRTPENPIPAQQNSGKHMVVGWRINYTPTPQDNVNSEDNEINQTDDFNPLPSYKAEQSPQDNPNVTYSRQTLPKKGLFSNIGKVTFSNGNQTFSDDQVTQAIRSRLINDINTTRQKYGLQPFTIDPNLQKISDMRVQQDYQAYCTQPPSYVNDKDSGRNNQSDDYIHGHDEHETVLDDARRLGVKIPFTMMGGYMIKQQGNTSEWGFPPIMQRTDSNAGSIGIGKDAYMDLYPQRYFIDDTTTPYGMADSNFDDMFYYDRASDNGHTEALLNPLTDEMGLSVYFFSGSPKDNPILKNNPNAKWIPIHDGVYATVEEDFGTSDQLNNSLKNYIMHHGCNVTSISGKPIQANILYQPSDIMWSDSTGNEDDVIMGGKIPATNHNLDISDAPVMNSDFNQVIGYLSRPDYLSGDVQVMPTLRIKTDSNNHVWGEYTLLTSNHEREILCYLPLGFNGSAITFPDSEDSNTNTDNTPSNRPNQPNKGKSNNGQPNKPNSNQPNKGKSNNGQPNKPSSNQPHKGKSSNGQPNKPNSNQPNKGKSNNGQPNNGQPNNGQPDNGQPNNGQPDNGQPNNGQPNNGQPDNGDDNGQPNGDDNQPSGNNDNQPSTPSSDNDGGGNGAGGHHTVINNNDHDDGDYGGDDDSGSADNNGNYNDNFKKFLDEIEADEKKDNPNSNQQNNNYDNNFQKFLNEILADEKKYEQNGQNNQPSNNNNDRTDNTSNNDQQTNDQTVNDTTKTDYMAEVNLDPAKLSSETDNINARLSSDEQSFAQQSAQNSLTANAEFRSLENEFASSASSYASPSASSMSSLDRLNQ